MKYPIKFPTTSCGVAALLTKENAIYSTNKKAALHSCKAAYFYCPQQNELSVASLGPLKILRRTLGKTQSPQLSHIRTVCTFCSR